MWIALLWAACAWADVTRTSIPNCWKSTKLILGESRALCEVVNCSKGAVDLLAELAVATGEEECGLDDCILDGEEMVEDPDSDLEDEAGDEEAPGGAEGVLLVGDGHSRFISLQTARAAALDLLILCMDNQDQPACSVLSEHARILSEGLQLVTSTPRHTQRSIEEGKSTMLHKPF